MIENKDMNHSHLFLWQGTRRPGTDFYSPSVRAVAGHTFSYKEPSRCAQTTSEPGGPAWSLRWSLLCLCCYVNNSAINPLYWQNLGWGNPKGCFKKTTLK